MTQDTGFLYPMIDGAETDVASLLADLSSSARAKLDESQDVAATARDRWASVLDAAADELARSAGTEGTVFTMGNGGSATDADGAAALFAAPPRGQALRARSLVADVAVVTALANDVGFDRVFARQVQAHGRSGDVLIGFSTSGNSQNLLAAFSAARSSGLTTIGFAGDRGGAMADSPDVDHLVIVETTSIHRIQEAQSALLYELWTRTQDRLSTVTTGASP